MWTATGMGRLLAPLLLSALAATASADTPPRLALPINCRLGETCHIQQFVDRAPTAERQDFGCGTLANDDHKGTDFALPSEAAMRAGVAVLAAAPGVVRGLRDGMPDIDATAAGAPDLTGRECGNGVVVTHPDGWETQYCHLRQGSIAVQMGQSVEAGTPLGLVGMSGLATFPHLHFAVRDGRAVIDPFQPNMSAPCNSTPGPGLWETALPYRPGGLITMGVLDRVPDYKEVKEGLPRLSLASEDPDALVVWGFVFAGQSGDTIEITLAQPGEALEPQRFVLEKSQPFLYRAWGLKAPAEGFAAGDYAGTIRHIRGDQELDRRTISFVLPGE